MKKISGKIINSDHSFTGTIEFSNKIHSIKKTSGTNSDLIIVPGFVDLHCHGGLGNDVMQGLDSIIKFSKYHLRNGTTTLLPTTLTASFDETLKAIKGLNYYIQENKYLTNINGIHLEGPFINPNKLGAQPPFTQTPNIEFIQKINNEANIKVITLAPEIDGMNNFINYLIKKNIKVQFGHSLADYSCCLSFMEKYKVGFTHLYNAMTGDHHRKPGMVTAALKHAKYAEIICDLIHVNEANILLAHKCISNLYAISDSISATGMPDGDYNFSNIKITKKNNSVFTKSNTLAGSVINMYNTFKNLLKINLSLENAVAMTSSNAASYIGEKNLGRIEEDYLANIVVLDSDLNIKEVYSYGNLIS